MFKKISKHLRSNKGDANVSKMTMIAIVFVVGAILLVMTTSAFRGPINRWFDKVQASWFADENGMFEADNKFLGYKKNTNGTYKNVEYRCYHADGSFSRLWAPENIQNGEFNDWEIGFDDCRPDGVCIGGGEYVGSDAYISEDGTTIKVDCDTYVAYIPE